MSRPAKTRPANLTINSKTDLLANRSEDTPPPQSSPMNLEGIDLSSFGGDFSTPLISLPPLPQSPSTSPRINRDTSKTFLTNFKSRLTSEQDQRAEPPQRRQVKDDDEYRPGSSSVSKIYHLRKNPGSTPELSLVGSAESDRKHSDDGESCEYSLILLGICVASALEIMTEGEVSSDGITAGACRLLLFTRNQLSNLFQPMSVGPTTKPRLTLHY